ncbi:F-box-like domain protein [Ceratobasidium sp. AG-Ba]|nr:F-box-like domain protein [Ceratobasidium sp. AG-Ba]QRW02284.1 F-box-like domain protein [Ceratobasidium sp. AG-Ba]
MLVSKAFCKMVRDEWNRHWPTSRTILGSAWSLARPNVFFERFTQPFDISPFGQLRLASLDFGYAFEHRDRNWQLLPLVAKLPQSLKEIEFLRAHASERDVIGLVVQLCPSIEVLRVVFCTMFNNPACTWWACHQGPTDHDYYMKGDDLIRVKHYAETVADMLQLLPRLKHLHLGVYFVSLPDVNVHRFHPEHVRHHPIKDSTRWLDRLNARNYAEFEAVWNVRHPTVPPPNIHQACLAEKRLWEVPCEPCHAQWSNTIKRAEQEAAKVIALGCPSLQTISFASFVSKNRTSPSKWGIGRSMMVIPMAGRVHSGGYLVGAHAFMLSLVLSRIHLIPIP